MTGGSGHIADMNNRIKQNRALKKSRGNKFKSYYKNLEKKKPRKQNVTHKELPPEERQKIIERVKRKIALERKRNRKIMIILSLLFISTLIFVLVILNV